MRLFIALPLPSAAEKELLEKISGVRRTVSGVKWVAPGQLHITLHFLGEVDEAKGREIATMLGEPRFVRPALPVSYQGLGQFPERGAPRVIVARLVQGAEDCARYHALLLGALRDLGLSPDARFTPHITLGRVRRQGRSGRSPGDDREGRRSIEPDSTAARARFTGEFIASRCVLYHSTLAPSGPSYRELFAIEFPHA